MNLRKPVSYLRSAVLSAGVLFGAGMLISTAQAADARIGHVEAMGQPLDKALREAVSKIEERTKGRVKFNVFPSSQLGDARAMTEAVQLGMQEAIVVPTAFLGGFNPLVSILDIPYLMPTSDEEANALRQSEFGKALLDSFKGQGLVAVTLWPGGFKQFTSNKALDDMKAFSGQRFRVMDSRVLRAQFESLGASALAIPFSEVYTALQTGVVDGQENPLDSISRMKFHEVQKYLLMSSHGVVENVVLLSPAFVARISADDLKVVREVFTEMTPVLAESKRNNQGQALEAIRKAGLTVRELSPEEQQKYRATMYPAAREAFLQQAGAEGEKLIETYERSYKKVSQ